MSHLRQYSAANCDIKASDVNSLTERLQQAACYWYDLIVQALLYPASLISTHQGLMMQTAEGRIWMQTHTGGDDASKAQ